MAFRARRLNELPAGAVRQLHRLAALALSRRGEYDPEHRRHHRGYECSLSHGMTSQCRILDQLAPALFASASRSAFVSGAAAGTSAVKRIFSFGRAVNRRRLRLMRSVLVAATAV